MLHDLISAPAICFSDGTFLSWGWVIGIVLSFSLIPGAYLLKAVEARHRRRIWAETQPAIDAGIRDMEIQLSKTIAFPMRKVAIMSFHCTDCGFDFSTRPSPYETVFCQKCGGVILRTPLSDELDYEAHP